MFRVQFKDVQIRGELLSWVVVLKTFDAATLIKHLASKGLKLDCYSGGRFADNVSAEEWEDNELHGRILKAGVQQIGSFVVCELTLDEAAAAECERPEPAWVDVGAVSEVADCCIPF